MQIPLYQIRNILQLYSRQLSLGRKQNKNNTFDIGVDHMDTSSKGKRQAIIDKVVSSILNRIITEKPSKKTKKEITRQIKKKSEKKINLSENKNKFIYNIIDGNNQTTTHTIPVKNSNFIVNRIIELTQEVSNNQSET